MFRDLGTVGKDDCVAPVASIDQKTSLCLEGGGDMLGTSPHECGLELYEGSQ